MASKILVKKFSIQYTPFFKCFMLRISVSLNKNLLPTYVVKLKGVSINNLPL